MRLLHLARNLLGRRRIEADLDAELHAYLDQLTDEKRRGGMSAGEARRAARVELGGVEQVKEEVRDVRAGNMLQELWQDLRYGLRTLRRNPAFTAIAVLALALGIGANTAMFSVAYGILMRPLPYADADRIAVVQMRYYPRDFAFGTMCIRDYLMWKEDNRAFEEPSLWRSLRMDLAGEEGVPEQVQAAAFTAGVFPALGVRPLIGRTFSAGEDVPGARSLAVLGESIWRRRFSADAGVLGRTILLNGEPRTVIGVMPGEFRYPQQQSEIWINLVVNPPTRYGPWFFRGVARLKRGVSMEQAQAELDRIGERMMRHNPYYKQLKLPALPLREAMLGVRVKAAILVLMGAVGLVLLIAVVNVANLMLARATVREREMALRLSLGAGGGRLVRQLLTESVLLAVMGGAAGLAIAWGAVSAIRVWNPGNLAFVDRIRLDAGALLFMAGVSVLTGILFGTVPALQSSRADLNSTIKEGGRGGTSRARRRTRAALVVAEIAISLMLLVGAGLLLRSFSNMQRVTGGFHAPPRQLLTMLISPDNRKYANAASGYAYYVDLLRRIRELPGVESAALTDSLPPNRQGDADSFGIEGQTLAPGEMNPVVAHLNVGAEFFRTLGAPLIRGRDFTPHDTPQSIPVIIVSEAFVQRFLPNTTGLGKRINYSGVWMEIVGVVGNMKYQGLTLDTDPAYYTPWGQLYGTRMYLAVRTAGDAAALAGEVQRTIRTIDPGVTLAQITTMEQSMALSLAQPRFDTMLLGAFAAIALLLAAVGIYGLMAYSVAQRTHEIGVRMALGAARADVVRMVVRQGVSRAAIGIGLGLAGAVLLTGVLKTMVFGVEVTDGFTFAAAPIGMLLVVLLATFLPALRATRISPVVALRYE
jgi:putative ABC transport system permease protein